MSRPDPNPTRAGAIEPRLGLASTTAIGIGGMVGGGIFAVLGLSAELARGAAPIAFAIAGGLALLTAASYAHLTINYPNRGGTVTFLNNAFGAGVIVGGLNVLLWLSYIVMVSLYATAFAAYAAGMLPSGATPLSRHLLASGIIIAVTALNIASAAIVGRAEQWIVVAKMAILALFVATGFRYVNWTQLAPPAWADPLAVIGGGMVIFVAYEGFELIANAAEDVRNPARTLPRALFLSVGLVAAIYVLVAMVTVGTLNTDQIRQASDNALAEAARPALGTAGFTLVAIAALLSTTSAINATLYGTARLSWSIARSGELPDVLDHKVWNRPIEGLFVTTGLSLVVVNVLDLSRIALVGSASFLIIFAAVNGASARLNPNKFRRAVSICGLVGCVAALAALTVEAWRVDPTSIVIITAIIASSFTGESIYRRASNRVIRLR